MQLTIFNVRHGFCAYAIADTTNVILFDCGHDEETEFYPSVWLPRSGCSAIETFIITNFDQDHVSNLPDLRRVLGINVLVRNSSIPSDALKRIKLQSGPISVAMESALEMHGSYNTPVTSPPDYGALTRRSFFNNYPGFQDTNNLSLVTFLHYHDLSVVIPGDLEKAGWEKLLEDPEFRRELNSVNIFVASHHGRANGYCEQVFNHCHPDIIIISDKEMVHDTQDHTYADHASGVRWSNDQTRYVLTTRSDGNIRIVKNQDSPYRITVGVPT